MSKPWKSHKTIEGNPVGLDKKSCASVIAELDAHLASLFVLYHQYYKHHWLVEGPQFRDVHHFFGEHYKEVNEHIDEVAERITALGGVPTCMPTNQAKLSYIDHEEEGIFRLRAMIERDRAAEGKIATKLRETVALAAKLGDYGTQHLLMEILLATENRAHHLDHFLGGDSLEMGLDA